MTRRVLLNSTGLKISKSGVDVLSASLAGLNYSSDWAGMGIYQTGSLTVNWNSNSTQSIALNKTFASPPITAFTWRYSGSDSLINIGLGFVMLKGVGDGDPVSDLGSRWGVAAKVNTNSITVWSSYFKETSGVITPSVTFRYTVFDTHF